MKKKCRVHVKSSMYAAVRLSLIMVLCQCQYTEKKPSATHEEEPALIANDPMMLLMTPEQTGVGFQNQIVESPNNNITSNVNIYNGGGVAVIDINNDNLPDLYFIGCSGVNGLFLNEGNFRFRDITQSAGVSSAEGFETSATAVDINADGFLDLYVCRSGPGVSNTRKNKLFINNKNLTFTERAAEYGLDDISASTGANFFDYDNDGDLDLYLLNYPAEKNYATKIESETDENGHRRPYLLPRDSFDSDRLYRNDGGRFTDVSRQAGIWELGYGLSVSVTDINRDGWLDVYVCNDFIHPDRLYINRKNGTFSDQLGDFFRHITHYSMGSDLTDFDNDGLVDMLAIDMLPEKNKRQKLNQATLDQSPYDNLIKNGYFPSVVRNQLQRNNGNGTFSDVGCLAGIYKTDWSWSGLLFDMDNDGLRDLHVTNGYRREYINKDFFNFTLPELQKSGGPAGSSGKTTVDINKLLDNIPTYKIRNHGFVNNGNWEFEPVGGKWMSMPPSWSGGSVWADLDADGDLDLVVNNLEQPAFLYQNLSRQKSDNHYLQVQFQGNLPNTFAVGASVRIEYDNGKVQYFENFPTRGIFSSVEHLAHFGLGKTTVVDRLTVRWPDGKTQVLNQVNADQRLVLKQTDGSGYLPSLSIPATGEHLFHDLSPALSSAYRHEENDFNDFDAYPMLPWTLSDLGPFMAVGDVNADGYDDLFIGNSFDQPAALLAQGPNGAFTPLSPELWQREKAYEDHGSLFFDADGDGDQDLLVVSGGMEAKKENTKYAWDNRLYINTDGKGKFTRAMTALPVNNGQLGLRATAHDYDADGDPDLFIGGRLLPGQWPLTPAGAILRNDKGKFTPVTAEVSPDFERCGMVTDLAWANLDADPEPELVAVGEWMPVSVFDWQQGKLVNATNKFGLDKTNGLWNRLAVADLDGDGDLDLVTGNLGINTRLTASAEGPLRCYAHDFDENGALDPIMAYFEDGKEYPLLQKEVLNRQMPVLKKKLLYATTYAEATIDKVWPRSALTAGSIFSAYMLETCWWENQNGKMIRHVLPVQAQTAPVQGIIVRDVNADGHPDIVLAGNKRGFEVETNRCDSGNGCVLLGDGRGTFAWMDNLLHGFWATGEVRDLALLRNPQNKPIVVVSNNNGHARACQLKKQPALAIQ
ncbi:MAG: VCBS repeat-containing protein [Saprospiraceae bacterium]|nr:VCBS repeat-containing protein [Saprospiraceae bacterium]